MIESQIDEWFENPVDFNMSQTYVLNLSSAFCLRTLWILICLKLDAGRAAGENV